MKKTRIVSFDPASVRNLGWADFLIYEEHGSVMDIECEAGTFIMPTVDETWKAMWPMSIAIDAFLSSKEPDLVILENTSSFSGGFVTAQVSGCIGLIHASCGRYELTVESVYPTHVKKIVSGDGRATKSKMKKAVKGWLEEITGQKLKLDSEHAFDACSNIICWLLDSGKIGP